MAFSAVTGKSVLLDDGQEQTEVVISDKASGTFVYRDHLSHPVGDIAALTVRVLALQAKLTTKQSPPALIPVGTVLDLTVPTPVVVPPTPTQAALANIVAYERAQRQQARFDALPPELQKDVSPGDL